MKTVTSPITISLGANDVPTNHEQETIIAIPRFNNQVRDMKVVRNVTQASLLAYLPDVALATGTAVIICPGGGFSSLPIEIEGTEVAAWLNSKGIAAFVLKYRLRPTEADDEVFIQQHQRPDMEKIYAHVPLAIEDASQAIRTVREHAAEWSINPQRVGLVGFSAGGLVAAATSAQDEPEKRPNFLASIYSPASPNLHPREDVLPLFMAFANDDPLLSLVSEGSMRLYQAWTAAKHPVEMHIYAKGGHGFGAFKQGIPCDYWLDRFVEWLGEQDF